MQLEEQLDPKTKCCLNCKWFEERTGFCRANPPTPFPMYIKNVGNINSSAFPKISIPELDWCRLFDNIHMQII